MDGVQVPKFEGSAAPAQSIAVGGGHMAVCSSDSRLFTWALEASLTNEDGFSCGQLGHGDIEQRCQPTVRPFDPPKRNIHRSHRSRLTGEA